MGKSWYLINLDKNEYILYGNLKLWEHSWFGAFQEILPLLIRPSDVLPIDLGFVRTKVRQWNEENTKATFEGVGRRLRTRTEYFFILNVGRAVQDAQRSSPHDSCGASIVISLGLTSTSFFALARCDIQGRYVKDIPRWIGDRIACAGDDTGHSDLLGLFTEDGLKTLYLNTGGDPEDDYDLDDIISRAGYYKPARIHYRRAALVQEEDGVVPGHPVLDERLGIDSRNSCLESILFDHLVKPTPTYSMEKDWVLCNLSKKNMPVRTTLRRP